MLRRYLLGAQENIRVNTRMKGFAIAWLLIIAITFYIVFFATFGNDGSIFVGCSNIAETRGGTICLDTAYKR